MLAVALIVSGLEGGNLSPSLFIVGVSGIHILQAVGWAVGWRPPSVLVMWVSVVQHTTSGFHQVDQDRKEKEGAQSLLHNLKGDTLSL